MIEIEITSSPDVDSIGIQTFHKNLIYFGHDKGEILIDDNGVVDFHAMLEVNENNCFIHLHKEMKYFHLNGKRTSGIVNLNSNDQITIGETSFLIKKAEYIHYPGKKEIIEQKLNELLETDAPQLELLSHLEEAIKK